MREIKFRAWGRDFMTDQLIMVKPFDFKKYVMFHEGAQSEMLPTVGEDVIYMQFTGLKDKNGVEIYEGDIVKSYGNVRTVEWNEGEAWCGGAIEYHHQGHTLDPSKETEVIGNIYENPELLESK